MSDLLPLNATPQEQALSEATARILDVPVPIRDVWNPDTCPAPLLAWLAWAFSVDQWDNSWTDAQKRALIKSSVETHRRKGTIGAVRGALAALSYTAQVQEWFNQSPAGAAFTFAVLLSVDQVGIDQSAYVSLIALIDRTKNLRSHVSAVALTVSTEAGPVQASAAGLGANVAITNYVPPIIVLNETAFCF